MLLARIRTTLVDIVHRARRLYFVRVWGMDIGAGTRISLSAKLDTTNPRGVHIGRDTQLAFESVVLTHDFVWSRHLDVHIGDNCLIGGRAVILPGVTIGDNCIVGMSSIVVQDVPSGSLVMGNPARIVEGNITTARWGNRAEVAEVGRGGSTGSARDAGTNRVAPVSLPRSVDDSAVAAQVVRLIQAELPDFSAADLDRTFEQIGLDSFALISLRTALEHVFERMIHDNAWSTVTTPADIARIVSLDPEKAGRARLEEGKVCATRHYDLSMPQMALGGLSESWLFKEFGDIHWSLITHGLGTPSSRLVDAAGCRLYATFTRIRVEAATPLSDFDEDESVDLASELSRYGAGMFFSEGRVHSNDKSVAVELMTSFAKHGESGQNTSLLKGQPEIPEGCRIPTRSSLPGFAEEYRAVRSTDVSEPLFECEYRIQPPHDINGVGLLYFAAYPMITDICAMEHAGSEYTTEYSTTMRDVYYFANSDPNDTLIFRIHSWKHGEGEVEMESSISRKSDGKMMAFVKTSKTAVSG